jgi:hypothetical protein
VPEAAISGPSGELHEPQGAGLLPACQATKTGKRRYFVAKTIGATALAELPDGFEIVESVKAVVSVRRIAPSARTIPETDLARVRAELGNDRAYVGIARTSSKERSSARHAGAVHRCRPDRHANHGGDGADRGRALRPSPMSCVPVRWS